jgi:hypothetical protein
MVPIGCLETSLKNCHYSQRNDPEERNSRKYYCLALTEMFRFKDVNTGMSQLLASSSSLLLFFRHLVPQVDLYFSVRRIILEIAFIYLLVISGAVGHIKKECDLKIVNLKWITEKTRGNASTWGGELCP